MSIDHKKSIESAAWRTAAEKSLETVRMPAASAIATRFGERVTPVAEFLRTKEGEALLAYALGVAMPNIPQLSGPQWERLAYELRTLGAKRVTDAVAETLIDPIVHALTEGVAGELPPAQKTLKKGTTK